MLLRYISTIAYKMQHYLENHLRISLIYISDIQVKEQELQLVEYDGSTPIFVDVCEDIFNISVE